MKRQFGAGAAWRGCNFAVKHIVPFKKILSILGLSDKQAGGCSRDLKAEKVMKIAQVFQIKDCTELLN